ncbi:MAG: NAD-dependent epimerase/dehydratase family protein [Planctomycetia bacterium]|nr:NAD-dependent epimerase/dehydratase family protein [Planctomycetia bacterium]
MIASHRNPQSGDCLITGATGLVGHNAVRQLVARGRAVRTLVRGGNALSDVAFAGLPVSRFTGSLDDEVTLQAAADGADSVIHAAAGHVAGGTARLSVAPVLREVPQPVLSRHPGRSRRGPDHGPRQCRPRRALPRAARVLRFLRVRRRRGGGAGIVRRGP